jgi:hypothetical protein
MTTTKDAKLSIKSFGSTKEINVSVLTEYAYLEVSTKRENGQEQNINFSMKKDEFRAFVNDLQKLI